jgi:hypothetical protein
MQKYLLSGPSVLNEKFMKKIWREITDFFLCPKNKNLIFVSCEKIYRCGGNDSFLCSIL